MCDTRKVDNKVKGVMILVFVCAAVIGGVNQLYDKTQEAEAKIEKEIEQSDAEMFYEIQAKEKFHNEINLDYIGHIESKNKADTKDSPKGARGQYQIMRGTWSECTELMGVSWNFDTDARDPVKNRKVADFYINTRIPNLLKCYNIPDSVQARLACYNWGIGRVNKAYKKYGTGWAEHVCKETADYLRQYNDLQR